MSLSLLTYADEKFGISETFENHLKLYYGGSMKEFLKDRKKLGKEQSMQILLAARVEIPSLICLKALFMEPAGVSDQSQLKMLRQCPPVVPVVVRKDGGA